MTVIVVNLILKIEQGQRLVSRWELATQTCVVLKLLLGLKL